MYGSQSVQHDAFYFNFIGTPFQYSSGEETFLERFQKILLQKPLRSEDFLMPCVKKLWYPLGLWLGLDENQLISMKHSAQHSDLEILLKQVFEVFENCLLATINIDRFPEWQVINEGSRLFLKVLVKEGFAALMEKSDRLGSQNVDLYSKIAMENLLNRVQVVREHKLAMAFAKIGYKNLVEEIKGKHAVHMTISFSNNIVMLCSQQ